MKADVIKNKKGYSLLETVIALSLIAIAFGAAITAILMSVNIRKQVMNTKYFITETSDFLECYKIKGADGFKANAELYLDCAGSLTIYEPKAEDGSSDKIVYAVYYTGGYKMLAEDEKDKAYFVMYITIDNSFDAVIKQVSDGKSVYSLKEPYYSRFDLKKA